jgi:hypothetical protein
MDENCFEPWFPVCDSGVGFPDEEYAACVSNACCAAFNACTMNGTDLAACIDCFDAGSGPLCDEAVLCAHECVAPCDHDECTVGGPLEESCSVCAVAVCKTDPLCCTVAWDAVCVDAVATNLACSGSGGITCP